jgi:long-chain acyl-CoA synthetase
MLTSTAARHARETALWWRGAEHSWEELAAAVRARATDFRERGVGPADAVALMLPNAPDFVASFFATTSLGAVAVPLNPGFTADEVSAALEGCAVPVFVAGEGQAPVANAFAGRRSGGVEVLVSDLGLPARLPDAPGPDQPISGDCDALYGFSSGTTGVAKRLARTQANLVHEAENFTATVGMQPDDVILGVAPFFHAHGLGNAVLAAVASGAALAIEERFDPRATLERTRQLGVTVLPGVPFMFRLMTRMGDPADLASLRLGFTAGAPLTREIFEACDKRFGRPIRQLYGCSEAGSVTINLDDDAAGTAETVGRPVRHVEVEVRDEHGALCETGTVGEIVIASPALTRGYQGREELSREAFRDGRFRTGDLGCLDDDGRLTITGRLKLFVSTPAGKVDPGEVERCIVSHPDVEEAVVVAVPSRGGDENVKVVVVARGGRLDGDGAIELRRELVRLCGEKLAQYKIPRIVEFRDVIPRSAIGKILRGKLVADQTGG